MNQSLINIGNIEEHFLNVCRIGNEKEIKRIIDSNLIDFINLNESNYESLNLIEKINLDLLEKFLLKKVKEECRIQNGNHYIDATTYYFLLSEETKSNIKLALSVLINGNEHLNLVPDKIKTPDFLEKLYKLNYKQNIFDYGFEYSEKYENFLISYISKGNMLSKEVKLNEDLLNDQNFISKATQYNCNIFPLIKEIYGNNLEIMTNVSTKEKGVFKQLNSAIRRKITKNKEIALKIIDIDVGNYLYLSKAMQLEEDIIIKVLSTKPKVYENFSDELKNDEIKTLNYIKNFDIDIKFLTDSVKRNKEIAFIMTEKNGNNFKYFPLFKNDKELVELALKTSKKLSLIPEELMNEELIKNVVTEANKEENSLNLIYMPLYIKEDRDFVLYLIKNDKLFKDDVFVLVNDNGKHKNDYEIVKESILKYNNLYGCFKEFKEDYEIIHIFIEGMKKATKGVYAFTSIPNKIRAEASMYKSPVDKYVFNKTMEKKSLNWSNDSKVKEKKLKL